MIKLDQLSQLHKPKIIIAGGSAILDLLILRNLERLQLNIILILVDMALFFRLVAGNVHPNPLIMDIVTTTTHKTLRSGRGGMILTNHENLFKKINSAVFPGSRWSFDACYCW